MFPRKLTTHTRLRLPGGFLLIEFFDEFAFTILALALPLLREAFHLDYAQVGLLVGLPLVVSTLVEPVLLVLGDTPLRTRLILGGGVALGATLLLAAGADSFAALVVALSLAGPASAAFVSLSQVEWIQRNPGRESQAMARWTASGTTGNLLGAPALALGLALGASFRSMLVVLAAAAIALTVRLSHHLRAQPGIRWAFPTSGRLMVGGVCTLSGRGRLWRWLILLPMADLMLDVFFGYIAVYLTDASGLEPAWAAMAGTLWVIGFLLGQVLIVPLLRRIDDVRLIRISAGLTVVAYPAWLLSRMASQVGGLLLLGLLAAPWYPLLKARAYAAAPDRPGLVAAFASVAGIVAGGLAFLVGWIAAERGLVAALTILLAGPLALLLFTPSILPAPSDDHPAESPPPAGYNSPARP